MDGRAFLPPNWSTAWPTLSVSVSAQSASPQFAVRGMVRQTCVVDGDTFWLKCEKIRIADIDTPEISEPRCDWEYDRGIEARDRLALLLSEGPFEFQPIGDRDEDHYGRKLRVVTRDGASLGDQLVSEGLARTWTGRRETWC
jgi:micrococcal nuclease